MNTIRVMTYNVCYYGDDAGTKGMPSEILEEKVNNLKTMLMATGPDFVGLQEDYPYIDEKATIQARTALFKPVWRFTQGTTETTLRAKYGLVSGTYQLRRFSTDRFYRTGLFNYTPTKQKILFISCHLSAYAKNENKRKTELVELFRFIAGETWDHCVVTGDFNTNTDSDRKTLMEMCDKAGFSAAIGPYLPWIRTCYGHDGKERYSFDNVLVSSGMAIRTVNVLGEWYWSLYSDHVPVLCEISF